MRINELFGQTAPATPSAAPATTKVASDNTNAAIKAAVAEALASNEKTASEGSAPEVTPLQPAQDLAAREKLADVNHGYRVGEAMSRGFLDGIARAEKIAAAQEEGAAKLAAEQDAAYQRGSAEVLNAARERGAEHYLVGYSMFEGMV